MNPTPDLIFFDLDDTLYPSDSGLWEAISSRIDLFLIEHMHLTQEEAQSSRARFSKSFGTTLAGLMSESKLDPSLYLEFVHDIDVKEFIQADRQLLDVLGRIEARRLIFTNASRLHAERVLAQLEIGRAIERIIAIEDLQFVNKPEPEAYRRALQLVGDPAPERCLILDDRLMNLIPAGRLGMITALVGSDHGAGEFTPDLALDSVLDLPDAMPGLFSDERPDYVRG